ncbi:MAG: hypothetical protein WCK13_10350 [Ignavibacteriota bacterium]|nr:hypothetical protein [Ignavibacteriota bacterium]
MKKLYVVFSIFAVLAMFGVTSNVHAQSTPVLYFCESYGNDGEVGISDRFTTGYLTVMVKCESALGLKNVTIQFDKYNVTTKTFEYYKKFTYVIEPTMKYVYFAKNSTSDMKFSDPGIYRVFLLDANGQTVTSSLIEVINQ